MSRYRVWANIDLAALANNYQALRSRVGPSTKTLAVLKANAYGHGAVEAATTLVEEGVDAIGVGNVEEGVELRQAGVRAPLLVLGAIIPQEAEEAVRFGIQVNVSSFEHAQQLDRAARAMGTIAQIHLLVDTGMGRLGAQPEEVESVAHAILRLPNVELVGVCTHLSSPGETGSSFTQLQLSRFRLAVHSLALSGISGLITHAASHTALLRFPEAHFDMVRPGLALFGLTGARFDPINDALQPVLSLRSQIVHLKNVDADTPISYSRLWTSKRATKIATIAAGYHDGLPVGLTGQGEVIIRGRRCPIVGRISMDYVMADVGNIPGVACGDEATLIGRDGEEEITLAELAGKLNTVPYELSCKLGSRVERCFVGREVAAMPLHHAPRKVA